MSRSRPRIPNPASLNDLHAYLEGHALEYLPQEVCGAFYDLAQRLEGPQREQALAEARLFHSQGLSPGQEEGEEALAHLESRLEATRNPALAARYAHRLWLCRKHQRWARRALDEYLRLLPELYARDEGCPEFGFWLAELFDGLLALAKATRRLEELRAAYLGHFTAWDAGRDSAIRVSLALAERFLESKAFGKDELGQAQDRLWALCEWATSQGHWYAVVELAPLGRRYEDKLRRGLHDWYAALAQGYEGLMDEREAKGDPLAALKFCQQALVTYRQAARPGDVERLAARYRQLAAGVRIPAYAVRVPAHLVQHYRKLAQGWAALEDAAFWTVIAEYCVPRRADAEPPEGGSLLAVLPSVAIGPNGTVAARASDGEEIRRARRAERYSTLLQLQMGLLSKALRERHAGGGLALDGLLGLLRESAWLAQEKVWPAPDGQVYVGSWMDLLEPALTHGWDLLLRELSGENVKTGWVLAVDSLAMKLEGLVREWWQLNGHSTLIQRNIDGQWVDREKDLNVLLAEGKADALLGEDTRYFLEFVLTSQLGLNLRNKVAHTLATPWEYQSGGFVLLLLALLRLALLE